MKPMWIDYLYELERKIGLGWTIYACSGTTDGDWMLDESLEQIRSQALRAASIRQYPVPVYRLVPPSEVRHGGSFLVVRRILDPSPSGAHHYLWALVDTQEAAEMVRDLSRGPTPFFGAELEQEVGSG